MKGKLIGIGLSSSIVILLIITMIIAMSGEFFSALNFQLLILFLTITIVLSGIYLLREFCPHAKPGIKKGIAALGAVVIIFAALVSFNILNILTTYNWLIALGILYVLLVQLQLMQWGNSPSIISKICSFIVIMADLFLVIYFIAEWRYSVISVAIDIAVLTSIVAFLIGVIANKKVIETA